MAYKGFYDLAHLQMYMRGGVVRVGKKPAYITEALENYDKAGKYTLKLRWMELGAQHESTHLVNLLSKRVNLSPVQLGFINGYGQNRAIIAARLPVRAWKVGLSANNLSIRGAAGDEQPQLNRDGVLISKELGKCITGDYPSYEKVGDMGMERGCSTAFDRHFAIKVSRKGNPKLIYYKYKVPVGKVGAVPTLDDRFIFLQEHLNEVMKCQVR